MVQKKRLYQILRQSGLVDVKAECLNILNAGRVTVNGRVMKNPEFQVNPKKEVVRLDGKIVELTSHKYYFMFNKPVNVLSHRMGTHGKTHMMELIDLPQEVKNKINPVGRLDLDSRGLIILTNDGDFASRLLRPHQKIEKEYEVTVKGELPDEIIKKVEAGIEITIKGDPRKHEPSRIKYHTKPCEIKVVERSEIATKFRIILREGKKRQIRHMMGKVDFRVTDLNRIRIGKLELGDLPEGQLKAIKKEDVI